MGLYTKFATSLTNFDLFSPRTEAMVPGDFPSVYKANRAFIGDLNGDGAPDILLRDSGMRFLNLGGTTELNFEARAGGVPTCVAGAEILDLNGDGKWDLACMDYANPAEFTKYANDGSGNFIARGGIAGLRGKNCPPEQGQTGSCGPQVRGERMYLAADFDGDGISDILEVGRGIELAPQVYNRFYRGQRDGNFVPITPNFSQYIMSSLSYQLLVGDFTGRGQVELLRLATIPSENAIFMRQAEPPDLLLLAKPSGGEPSTFVYGTATDTTLYTRTGDSVYPVVDVPRSHWLVREVQAPNGLGGTTSTTFKYSDLRADMKGRGSLGFKTITRTTPGADGTPMSAMTEYRQFFPFIGREAMTITFPAAQGSAAWVARTGPDWMDLWNNPCNKNPDPDTPKLSKPVVGAHANETRDLNGKPISSTITYYRSYNCYGEAGEVTVESSNSQDSTVVYRKVTTNTYLPVQTSGDSWRLGRLSSSRQDNSVPELLPIKRTVANVLQTTGPVTDINNPWRSNACMSPSAPPNQVVVGATSVPGRWVIGGASKAGTFINGVFRQEFVYTNDSWVPLAATHAGLVQPGRRAYIVTTAFPSPDDYVGSYANGILSQSWPGSPMCGYSVRAATADEVGLPAWSGVEGGATLVERREAGFEYDAATGILNAEIVEPNDPAKCVRTAYELDEYGNRKKVTVSNCSGAPASAAFATRVTQATFLDIHATVGGETIQNPRGAFQSAQINALGHSESRLWDARYGVPLNHVGANALLTQFQYDKLGRKTLEVAPDGNQVSTRYCWITSKVPDGAASNHAACTQNLPYAPSNAFSYVETQPLDASDNPSGPYSRKYLDSLGRVIRAEAQGFDGVDQPANARVIVKDTEYNIYGAARRVTQPFFAATGGSLATGGNGAGWTVTEYNALGKPVSVSSRDTEGASGDLGPVSRSTYEYHGPVTLETRTRTWKDTSGVQQAETVLTTAVVKNPLGEVVQVIDSADGSLRKRYDPFGNLVEVRDALDNLTTAVYDKRGNKLTTVDPNAGTWTYSYDALGQLKTQRGPNQQADTTFEYDVLGRMATRADPTEYTTTWTYDQYVGGAACNKGLGKLCEVRTTHGARKVFFYDNLGRPSTTTQYLDGAPAMSTTRGYDSKGRVASYNYPTGLTLAYSYTALGYLSQIDRAAGAVWVLKNVNAWGKPERYQLGAGAQETFESFDAYTGRPIDVTVLNGTNNYLMYQGYGWDTVGNLTNRTDRYNPAANQNVTETFGYDVLNRLTSYQTSSPGLPGLSKDVTLTYDAIGNIRTKSDVGTYTYPASGPGVVRPMAVQGITGAGGTRTFGYDGAGNLISATGGKYFSASYTSFNQPATLNGPAASYNWQYGPDHERVKEVRGSRTTYYYHPDNAGGLAFELENNAGVYTNRHYVSAMGRTVALLESQGLPGEVSSQAVTKTQWWHTDMLGSLAMVTDQNFAVVRRMSYDPFGKRREITGEYDSNGALVITDPDRGFTGHEHLDDVGVIHMNGRIYDPTIARFMQADPFIQHENNLQSYNRYSYLLNNPLNGTDPTGHFKLDKVLKVAGLIAIAVFMPEMIVNAWMCTPGIASQATMWAVASAITGATIATIASDGDMNSIMRGAITGGMFGYAGQTWDAGSFENYAAHAVIGCADGAMGGTGCSRGAASAFAGKWMTVHLPSNDVLKAVGAVVSGGVASRIAGGTFENGATTAAFGYLFNHLSSWQKAQQAAAESYRALGWTVEEGVKVLLRGLPGELDAYGIADFIATKNGQVIVGEVKEGLFAKLTNFQKALLNSESALGRLEIASAERALALGLQAGVPFSNQMEVGAKIMYTLTGELAGRAGRQWTMRNGGALATKVFFNGLKFLGSVPVILLTQPGN